MRPSSVAAAVIIDRYGRESWLEVEFLTGACKFDSSPLSRQKDLRRLEPGPRGGEHVPEGVRQPTHTAAPLGRGFYDPRKFSQACTGLASLVAGRAF
jgi:hypothetical protein